MTDKYLVTLIGDEEIPQPRRDCITFRYGFCYVSLNENGNIDRQHPKRTLRVQYSIDGMQKVHWRLTDGDLRKALYKYAIHDLPELIAQGTTGFVDREVPESDENPPDLTDVDYPPLQPFVEEVERRIGF